MSTKTQVAVPLVTLGMGWILGALLAKDEPVTAGIIALVFVGLGIAAFLEGRHDAWAEENRKVRREYLGPFCDGLDVISGDWRKPDASVRELAPRIARKIYPKKAGPLTAADRSTLGKETFKAFDTARGGFLDICDKWGERKFSPGFSGFLDARWKEHGKLITILAFVEEAKAEASGQTGLVESSGLAKIIAHYAPDLIQLESGPTSSPRLLQSSIHDSSDQRP